MTRETWISVCVVGMLICSVISTIGWAHVRRCKARQWSEDIQSIAIWNRVLSDAEFAEAQRPGRRGRLYETPMGAPFRDAAGLSDAAAWATINYTTGETGYFIVWKDGDVSSTARDDAFRQSRAGIWAAADAKGALFAFLREVMRSDRTVSVSARYSDPNGTVHTADRVPISLLEGMAR